MHGRSLSKISPEKLQLHQKVFLKKQKNPLKAVFVERFNRTLFDVSEEPK